MVTNMGKKRPVVPPTPSSADTLMMLTPEFTLSQPWSNSSPSGEEEPVFLACGPQTHRQSDPVIPRADATSRKFGRAYLLSVHVV